MRYWNSGWASAPLTSILANIGKGDAVILLAEGADLRLAARLLAAELVARKAQDGQALWLELCVERFQPGILRSKAAFAGGVDDQKHTARATSPAATSSPAQFARGVFVDGHGGEPATTFASGASSGSAGHPALVVLYHSARLLRLIGLAGMGLAIGRTRLGRAAAEMEFGSPRDRRSASGTCGR